MSSTPSLNEKEQDFKVEDAAVGLVKPDKEFTIEEEDKMHRRMDWRIMPILALLYCEHSLSIERTDLVISSPLSFIFFRLIKVFPPGSDVVYGPGKHRKRSVSRLRVAQFDCCQNLKLTDVETSWNFSLFRLYMLEADLGMLGTMNYNIALSVYFLTYCKIHRSFYAIDSH